MPELPEVETIRTDLDAAFGGRTIVQVAATGARTLRRHATPESFVSRVEGRRLTAVGRRGKYLLLGLDGGDVVVVHLGMSGQLLALDPLAPITRHTHVRWAFAGGPELRFVDPRTFGEVFVTAPVVGSSAGDLPELAHLGVDPLDEGLTARILAGRLAARRTRLKPLLMDQRFVAGIGNMYADEILWMARLAPDRPAHLLSRPAAHRLHGAMVETLRSAVQHRGSSLADEQYRDLYGAVGGYQRLHNVYARAGEPCPRCRRPIERVMLFGRGTSLCRRCQR